MTFRPTLPAPPRAASGGRLCYPGPGLSANAQSHESPTQTGPRQPLTESQSERAALPVRDHPRHCQRTTTYLAEYGPHDPACGRVRSAETVACSHRMSFAPQGLPVRVVGSKEGKDNHPKPPRSRMSPTPHLAGPIVSGYRQASIPDSAPLSRGPASDSQRPCWPEKHDNRSPYVHGAAGVSPRRPCQPRLGGDR